jgi:hypothetical protein
MRGLGSAVVTVTAAVWCIGVCAAQADTWVPQSPPSSNALVGGLSGVSCTRRDACEAVGGFLPLAIRWNGTEWTAQSTADSIGTLNAVSCARVNACLAIGADPVGVPIAARWDGLAWQSVPLPAGAGNTAISCPTGTFCMAVGGDATESWDGTAWTSQPLPDVISPYQLSGISCTSPRACIAVGGIVVERWNGVRWSRQASPPEGGLYAVSCRSATWCMAVGGIHSVAYAARWNGRRWHTVRTQPPPPQLDPSTPSGSLDSVSCRGSFCIAAGTRIVEGFAPLLAVFAERWTGSEFRLTAPPFGEGGGSATAGNSLSCPTWGSCELVARAEGLGTRTAPLAAAYSG